MQTIIIFKSLLIFQQIITNKNGSYFELFSKTYLTITNYKLDNFIKVQIPSTLTSLNPKRRYRL